MCSGVLLLRRAEDVEERSRRGLERAVAPAHRTDAVSCDRDRVDNPVLDDRGLGLDQCDLLSVGAIVRSNVICDARSAGEPPTLRLE